MESVLVFSKAIPQTTELSRPQAKIIEASITEKEKEAATNQIMQQLQIPDVSTMRESHLTANERSEIIKNTIKEYTSLNFTETETSNMDGTKTTVFTATVDFNYDLAFGEQKSEMTKQIGETFDKAANAITTYSDITRTNSGLTLGTTVVNDALKLKNGESQDVALDIVKEGAKTITKYAADIADSIGIIEAGGIVGERVGGVVGALLTPIEAGGALPPAIMEKREETKTLKTNTVSALLYLFMKEGKDNGGIKVNLEAELKSSSDKPATDHPEDNQSRNSTPHNE